MSEFHGAFQGGTVRSSMPGSRYELRGGQVYYDGSLMNGTVIGVIYDRDLSVLLKHGNADLVEQRYREMIRAYASNGGRPGNLVMLTVDVRDTGVAWLNDAITVSGSITRYVRALAQEMKVELPKGVA